MTRADYLPPVQEHFLHEGTHRPANAARSLFHVLSALTALLLVQLVFTPGTMILAAGAFAASAWSMEIGRRVSPRVNELLMWLFGMVAHAHERERVNSATWYATALFGLALTASPLACSLALVVLGLGDPAAGYVGRRFGRTRLAANRTLEGSAAFVVAGGLASLLALRAFYPEIALLPAAALAFGAALAGAIAEVGARRIDDNLAIPLAAAAGASLVALVI